MLFLCIAVNFVSFNEPVNPMPVQQGGGGGGGGQLQEQTLFRGEATDQHQGQKKVLRYKQINGYSGCLKELTQKLFLFQEDPGLCLSEVILVLLNQILPLALLDQPLLTKQHFLLMDLRAASLNQHYIIQSTENLSNYILSYH